MCNNGSVVQCTRRRASNAGIGVEVPAGLPIRGMMRGMMSFKDWVRNLFSPRPKISGVSGSDKPDFHQRKGSQTRDGSIVWTTMGRASGSQKVIPRMRVVQSEEKTLGV
jgi:hypothetical protein